jgi:hypothetical protein
MVMVEPPVVIVWPLISSVEAPGRTEIMFPLIRVVIAVWVGADELMILALPVMTSFSLVLTGASGTADCRMFVRQSNARGCRCGIEAIAFRDSNCRL